MRVSKEKAAENRRQIVDAAAGLFRERGIGATGVDSIAREAGLTHGAVYSQFGSKEAIAIDSIRLALRGSRRAWIRAAAKKGAVFRTIVESYLSARHRDAPGTGCVIAALGGDIARQPRRVRDAFTDEFKQASEFLAEVLASDDGAITGDDALATFASMAGALMLARAVSDQALSDRILKATSSWINRKARSAHPRRTTARIG